MYKVFNGKVTIIIPGVSYTPTPHFFTRLRIIEGWHYIIFYAGFKGRESSVRHKPCKQASENCSYGENVKDRDLHTTC